MTGAIAIQYFSRPLSYAETKKETPINWWLLLDKLEAEYNPELHSQAWSRALSWTTCATGNLCASLPRNPDGAPEDERLQRLGGEFYACIKRRTYTEARDALFKIEERSAYLLQLK